MGEPSASVVIPARDASATIGRTLACLEAQEGSFRFEVIVVDDGSRDETGAIAESSALDATIIRQGRLGAVAARNRGVAAAAAPAIAFLDSDCFPTAGWLEAGIKAMGNAELVQGQVLPDPQARLGPFDRTLLITENVGLWQTANLFVTREVFDRIGGFEDWLSVKVGKLMAEDVWFGWRATRAGARPAFCAEALAHHAVFPRGPLGYVGERRRLRNFPAIARQTPELRKTMFYRRLFLSRQTAVFDLGTAATAVALALRSPLPLVAWAPYALGTRSRMRWRGRRAPVVAAVDLLAEAVGLLELLGGSVESRTVLL